MSSILDDITKRLEDYGITVISINITGHVPNNATTATNEMDLTVVTDETQHQTTVRADRLNNDAEEVVKSIVPHLHPRSGPTFGTITVSSPGEPVSAYCANCGKQEVVDASYDSLDGADVSLLQLYAYSKLADHSC